MIPAGSVYETEQAKAAQEVADAKPVEQPTKATASAIELGTFESGLDEDETENIDV